MSSVVPARPGSRSRPGQGIRGGSLGLVLGLQGRSEGPEEPARELCARVGTHRPATVQHGSRRPLVVWSVYQNCHMWPRPRLGQRGSRQPWSFHRREIKTQRPPDTCRATQPVLGGPGTRSVPPKPRKPGAIPAAEARAHWPERPEYKLQPNTAVRSLREGGSPGWGALSPGGDGVRVWSSSSPCPLPRACRIQC